MIKFLNKYKLICFVSILILALAFYYFYIINDNEQRPVVQNSTQTPIPQSKSTQIPTQHQTSSEYKLVTVAELVSNPKAYVLKKIQLKGKIINKENYFTGNFFITDGRNKFWVNAWVPLEVALPQYKYNGSFNPITMGTYLNKNLLLQGIIVFSEYNHLYQLKVFSAKIIK